MNTERRQFGEKLIVLPLLINGVLFTVTIVLLQNLLGASNLDTWLTIALTLFGVALPCLAGFALVIYAIQGARVDPQKRTKAFLLLQYIGLVTDILGIMVYMWHTSPIAGPVFTVTAIIVWVVCAITYNHIVEIHDEAFPLEKQTDKQENEPAC